LFSKTVRSSEVTHLGVNFSVLLPFGSQIGGILTVVDLVLPLITIFGLNKATLIEKTVNLKEEKVKNE
jgi:hypothetical protein